MVAAGGWCRLDDLAPVEDTDRCLVPVVPKGEMPPYGEVPLLYDGPCEVIEEMVGGEAFEARKPARCEPKGEVWPLSVVATIEEGVKARYPGFDGMVMQVQDPDEAEEERLIVLGALGVGLALVVGGLVALWQSLRKRA